MGKVLLAVVGAGTAGFMVMVTGAVTVYHMLPPVLEPVMCLETALPLTVPQTALEVLTVTCYAGPSPEHPEDPETVDAGAILVRNTGDLYIARGAVVLEQPPRTLVFEIMELPPGQKALVVEKEGQPYVPGAAWRCYGWAREEYPEQHSWVEVTQEPRGLAVTNIASHTLPYVELVCKRRQEGSETFVGGIAWHACVIELQPGETRLVIPRYYIQGKVAVVRVLIGQGA